MRFTRPPPAVVKILYMAKKLRGGQSLAATPRAEPTEMGRRIRTLMTANNITNQAQFAEGVLGISRQRFHAWLHKELRDVEAKPILRCAEALSTNAEYLLCISDDPRPTHAVSYREAQLIEAFRVLSETDQDRLLKNATDWIGQTESARTSAAPFRHRPLETIIERGGRDEDRD